MNKQIIVPRIVVRPVLPPPLTIGVRIRPQWLQWEIGQYKERLSFGFGGKGKVNIWTPARQGEQHNLILNQFYDNLIPQYGLIGSSLYAAVGRGSIAPSPTDTQLADEIGSSGSPLRSNAVPSGDSNKIEPLATNGVYNIKRSYEFTEAQVGGLNLTEWGFGPTNNRNGPLMTRELFRDGSGNPITLTPATDQRLRLVYRYQVSLSPVFAQPVTVNIGGSGPGARAAQFIITGLHHYSSGNNPSSYSGISTTGSNSRLGDILVCESMARGTNIGDVGTVFVSSNAAPLIYNHATSSIGGSSSRQVLTYDPPVGRTRKASYLANVSIFVQTIKSVCLVSGSGNSTPTLNLVFNNGEEFTKDNLHKLLIAYWQITWQP